MNILLFAGMSAVGNYVTVVKSVGLHVSVPVLVTKAAYLTEVSKKGNSNYFY